MEKLSVSSCFYNQILQLKDLTRPLNAEGLKELSEEIRMLYSELSEPQKDLDVTFEAYMEFVRYAAETYRAFQEDAASLLGSVAAAGSPGEHVGEEFTEGDVETVGEVSDTEA